MQENMMGAPARMLGTPYAIKQSALLSPLNQVPCTAPPYAELVAVDLQQGEILWRGTLGVWDHTLPPPMAAPYSLPLPLKWGTPTFGGPMLTAGGLVFIGGFQHPPNTDAVLWYAQEVLPHVRAALPGVVTYIVGSSVPANVRALAAEDFVVTGYVPDVTPYFMGCRVSIAPLRYGAGVKGKINLAMSYGLPVVATTPSIEGMSLVPERDVLVADEAKDFADAIVRLYHDEALWNQLAAGGRENIRTYFSRDVARSTITRLIAFAKSSAASVATQASA
jgi:hypothetical protein